MSDLWYERVNYKQFESKRHHINETCGRYNLFIPYERKYRTLNKEQLLELIHDAKVNHWQALDLSNCGLSQLPDELWDLPDLKMLYLGNRTSSRRGQEVDTARNNDNQFGLLPRKIEMLSNLQVLSLSKNPVQIEGETPLNLPRLIHLDIFDCGFPQIPRTLLIGSL